MIYMLEQLMASSTRNEMVIKRNIAIIIGLLVILKAIGMLNIKFLNYLIASTPFYLFETSVIGYCGYNVWKHSGYEGSPLQSWIGGPLYKDAFQFGPLTRLLVNLPWVTYNYLSQKKTKPAAPAPTPAPVASIPTAAPAPTLTFRSTPWNGPIADSPLDAARSTFGPNTGPVQDLRDLVNVPIPERLGDPSLFITLPKLESRPCHMTRRKKTARMNKYLWRLNPQPNIVERFREEQLDGGLYGQPGSLR
ncbi:hypothetical protein BJV82DRAFT_208327 [Fennellomyces sp. T-0311]|nr:hypothetical protein BJV82DRAFT_208327 [Fennellomyces sp. T-0311]